ncbi:hypothetical protein RKD33_004529 [Streptomyces sp. SAI-129]
MATAISDVIMNQRRVRDARRAALLTFLRLVIETRIAKKTSGGDGQLQQADEGVADLLQGGDQPRYVLAAGQPAQQDTEDEAAEYLGPEGHLEVLRERRG